MVRTRVRSLRNQMRYDWSDPQNWVCHRCGGQKSLRDDGIGGYCKTCAKNNLKRRYEQYPSRRIRKIIRDRCRFYKISVTEFVAATLRQRGMCGICDTKMERPCADHDHVTGRFRGFLCRRCNLGIGHLRDDAEIIARAVKWTTQPY